MLPRPSEFLVCSCGTPIPPHVRDCLGCGKSVGFPNVRKAAQRSEREALVARIKTAEQSASAGKYQPELEAFANAVATASHAVIARSLMALDAFIRSDSQLMTSFYKQVRAQSRVPEDNDWDRGRAAADSTINPIYFEEIQFAALSLDGLGSKWYGAYHITIKDLMIEQRASVFEENPFLFCERKGVAAGAAAPPGYRATWEDRGLLAKAKLFHRLRKDMEASEFPGVLLQQGADLRSNDFIEVQVYGALHPAVIERVRGPAPQKSDKALWRQVLRRLNELGAVFEES